jgi:hypothetical protein
MVGRRLWATRGEEPVERAARTVRRRRRGMENRSEPERKGVEFKITIISSLVNLFCDSPEGYQESGGVHPSVRSG